MLIDRSHRPWAAFISLATLVSVALYIHRFHPAWLPFLPQPSSVQPRITPGRTTLGLVYGCVALAIFLFACMLGWRRKRPTLPLGTVQTWLRAHIWLSVFTIPLVLMHAGFVVGGPMTTVLMGLYAIVMASGFFGLALQQFLPRMMTDDLPTEAVYEQIPYLRSQLLAQAEAICKDLVPASAAVLAAPGHDATSVAVLPPETAQQIDEIVLPYLGARSGKRMALGSVQSSNSFFRRLCLETPADLEPLILKLQGLCDERRQLDLQNTYQLWLHGWLVVHVPLSLALLILTLWHAVVSQFFV